MARPRPWSKPVSGVRAADEAARMAGRRDALDDSDAASGNAGIRPLLDYTYHGTYSDERMAVQDRIIEKLYSGARPRREKFPWVVFTAGAMGAGKGFVTRWMHEQGIWNLDTFVKVDPDEVRHELPEWDEYVRNDPETAGNLTQKEAGFIAEILSYKALLGRRNVIIDGSLRDAAWYSKYFATLRQLFPGIRIMILHVVADLPDVLERATQRALSTGRCVPRHTLISSASEVPASVQKLAPQADFVCRVWNGPAGEPEILREIGAPFPPPAVPVTWNLVRKLWRPVGSPTRLDCTRQELRSAIDEGLLTQRVIRTIDMNGDGRISKLEMAIAGLIAFGPRGRKCCA